MRELHSMEWHNLSAEWYLYLPDTEAICGMDVIVQPRWSAYY